MSKRLTDTDKWRDPWYCGLKDAEKVFWSYLLDTCNLAGIWQVSWSVVEIYIPNLTFQAERFGRSRIVPLNEEKWWIPKFVIFQYGAFQSASRTHQRALFELIKGRVWIPYGYPMDTLSGWGTALNSAIEKIDLKTDKDTTETKKDKDNYKDKDKRDTSLERSGKPFLTPTDDRETPLLVPSERTSDALFPVFWKAYPKKVGKVPALKAWDRLRPNDELFRKILAGVDLWRVSAQWTKDAGEFIPHPATWLNRRGWEDEVHVAAGAGSPRKEPLGL